MVNYTAASSTTGIQYWPYMGTSTTTNPYWSSPQVYAADPYVQQQLLAQQQYYQGQLAAQQMFAAQQYQPLADAVWADAAWLAQMQADTHHHEAYQRMIDADRVRAREELARAEQARTQAARNRESAERRAQELLMEHLTEAQRKTIKDHGWFVVVGGKSKKRYRIGTNGVSGNVLEMQDGVPSTRLCCHLDHAIPRADHWLAQKLALEMDEAQFLRTANRSAVA